MVIVFNDGNAVFDESVRLRGIRPTAVATADFDEDGDVDIVFGGNDNVTFWLNDGNGVFENTSSLSLFSAITEMVTGDFNGDGLHTRCLIITIIYSRPGSFKNFGAVIHEGGNIV